MNVDDEAINGELTRYIELMATGDIEAFLRHIPKRVADQRRASIIVQAAIYRKTILIEQRLNGLIKREWKLWGVATLALALAILATAKVVGLSLEVSLIGAIISTLIAVGIRGLWEG